MVDGAQLLAIRVWQSTTCDSIPVLCVLLASSHYAPRHGDIVETELPEPRRRKKNPRKIVGRNTKGLKRGGPGRPRGRLNKVTTEVREAAAALVDDPVYRQKLMADMRKRR